jgi:hypothetical protein
MFLCDPCPLVEGDVEIWMALYRRLELRFSGECRTGWVGQVSIVASFGTKFQQQGGAGRGSLLASCT